MIVSHNQKVDTFGNMLDSQIENAIVH